MPLPQLSYTYTDLFTLSKTKKVRLIKSNKMDYIQFKFNEIARINRKRNRISRKYWPLSKRKKKGKRRREEQYDENGNFNLMTKVLYTGEGILRVNKRMNTERGRNVIRNVGKLW